MVAEFIVYEYLSLKRFITIASQCVGCNNSLAMRWL